MRADVGQPGLDFGDPCGSCSRVRLGQQPRALGSARAPLDQALGAVRRFLRQPADAPARRHARSAVLGRDSPVMTLNSVRLAAAVAADEADPRAVRNPNRGVLDQQAAGDADGEVVDEEHGARSMAERAARRNPHCAAQGREQCWCVPSA